MSQSVLVTGAASGMGHATCRLLSRRGYTVIGVDIDAEGLGRLREEAAARSVHVVDLADEASIRGELGGMRVDSLVNVAGLGPDAKRPEAIWSVNLLAPLRLASAVEVREGGSIVNVASVTGELADEAHAGLLDDPLRPEFLPDVISVLGDGPLAYTYSKWAILRETERMAVRCAPSIRVNAVSPGIIATPLGERSMQYTWTRKTAQRIPADRLGTAVEVANAIAFLVSDEASYVTGSRLIVDGGYVASRRIAR